MGNKHCIKRTVVVVFFLSVANIVAAQGERKSRFVLWDEPYDYALGVSYGYSDMSRSTIGLEWKCRWFGVGVELGTGVHPINIHDAEIAQYIIDANRFAGIHDIRVQGFSRYYFMLNISAHLRYFSIGIGWGATEWNFTAEGNIESAFVRTHATFNLNINNRSGSLHPNYWLRPYIEGHLPLFDNKLVVSLKVGTGFALNFSEIYAFKLNYGMYYGVGILKTL